jgi:cbb3-type cytochrome oxidase subunit 3
MLVAFELPVFKLGIAFISSTFYGLFLILFILSAFILHRQSKKNSQEYASSTKIYLAFSYIMLIVLTAVRMAHSSWFTLDSLIANLINRCGSCQL